MDVVVLCPHFELGHAGRSESKLSRLLGCVRRVAALFHQSTTAYAVFKAKQKQLKIDKKLESENKLIIDVTTRWNSSLDML